MSRVPVLTIDGPSGSGKGTIARNVASELGWHLLDSGALYRLAAIAAERQGRLDADPADLAAIAGSMDVRFAATPTGDEQILLGNHDVTAEVRLEETGAKASGIAGLAPVREALLDLQREFLKPPGLVADGRDMGTRIFPDAALKVFLTASAEERAKRRYKQLKDKGIDVSLRALSRDIEDRDKRDSERSVAPLRPASDARILDSSNLGIEQVTRQVIDWVRETILAN